MKNYAFPTHHVKLQKQSIAKALIGFNRLKTELPAG